MWRIVSLLKRVQTVQKVFFILLLFLSVFLGSWCIAVCLTVPVCVLNKVSKFNSGRFLGYSFDAGKKKKEKRLTAAAASASAAAVLGF